MEEKELKLIIDNILSIKIIFFKALVNSRGLKTLISPAIYYLMMALERHGSLSMSSIGKEIYMPKPNVTALVDKLISNNLVERSHDLNDRRKINIRLTKKGLKTKMELEKLFMEQTRQKLSLLTKNEIESLSGSLVTVRKMLTKIHK